MKTFRFERKISLTNLIRYEPHTIRLLPIKTFAHERFLKRTLDFKELTLDRWVYKLNSLLTYCIRTLSDMKLDNTNLTRYEHCPSRTTANYPLPKLIYFYELWSGKRSLRFPSIKAHRVEFRESSPIKPKM